MALPISRIVYNGGQGFLTGTVISQADMDLELDQLISVVNELYSTKVAKSGDTMTGLLQLSGNATNALNPVTKQQWDAENTAKQTEIDLIETSVGLLSTGGLSAWSGTNYLDAQATFKAAATALDTAIKANADAMMKKDGTVTATGNFNMGGNKLTNTGQATTTGDAVVLDGSSKIPTSLLPSSVLGTVQYQGTWNASTNSPTLADGTGTQGHYYTVSTGASRDLGSGSIAFNIGDHVIHNGSVWEKIDNTDAVTSVHGRTGAVSSAASDYDASQIDNDSSVSGAQVNNALDNLLSAIQSNDSDISTLQSGKADKSGNLSQFTGSNLTQIGTRNFSDLQSKPTTLSGYGIIDALSAFATGIGQVDTGEVSAEAGPTNDTQSLSCTGIGDTSYAAVIFATVRYATNTASMVVVFIRPKGTSNWYYKMDVHDAGHNTGVAQSSTASGTDSSARNYSIALSSVTSNSLDMTFEHSEAAALKGTALGFTFKVS